MTEDIVYIVRVKPEFQINFKGTTINYEFAGKILAQIRDAYVFELNGIYGAIVIIPLDWIECMAPSKVHFELIQRKDCPSWIKENLNLGWGIEEK